MASKRQAEVEGKCASSKGGQKKEEDDEYFDYQRSRHSLGKARKHKATKQTYTRGNNLQDTYHQSLILVIITYKIHNNI